MVCLTVWLSASGRSRAFTFFYLFMEGFAVIQTETLRNVGAAAGAVLIVSLVLLADVWAAALVFALIVVIDVDLLGLLYFAGLEYNSVTAVNIVLSIGLSVDYSMHVAHSFLVEQGSRDERAKGALAHIGRSVFNGGLTTFLAVVPLAASESYVFKVFFTCFSLTIGLGLFHGLIFLPVLLSLVGPPAYQERPEEGSEVPSPGVKVREVELVPGQPKDV